MTGVRCAPVFRTAGKSALRIMTRWIPATLTVSIRNRNALFRTIRLVTASISSPLIFVSRDVCRSNSGYDIERTAVRTLSCSGLKNRLYGVLPSWLDGFYIPFSILPQVTEQSLYRPQSLLYASDNMPIPDSFCGRKHPVLHPGKPFAMRDTMGCGLPDLSRHGRIPWNRHNRSI